MEDLLQRLENKIKELAEHHDWLKESNLQLHQGKTLLACEKEALLAKQQKTISQIETLVSKLKSIEKQL